MRSGAGYGAPDAQSERPVEAYADGVSDQPFPRTRWSEVAGIPGHAAAYQQRFDDLASAGTDVHGEARHVVGVVPAPARVLDAGCGTGRVASELTLLGYRVTGVDASAEMVAVATKRDPATRYECQDLADPFLRSQAFDLVLLAGNVIPLLAPGTLDRVMRRIAAHTQAGGTVVAGFGLDAAHLPAGCPVTPLAEYDDACVAAGLAPLLRFGTWDRQRWTPDTGYVVTHHLMP